MRNNQNRRRIQPNSHITIHNSFIDIRIDSAFSLAPPQIRLHPHGQFVISNVISHGWDSFDWSFGSMSDLDQESDECSYSFSSMDSYEQEYQQEQTQVEPGLSKAQISRLPVIQFGAKKRPATRNSTRRPLKKAKDLKEPKESKESKEPKETKEKSEPENCTICLCRYKSKQLLRVLACGHRFHQGCIDVWLQQTGSCPLCKCPALGR